jgi:hypothetical protein
MHNLKKVLALSLATGLLVFAGATGALATHKPGHQEPPSCDPHPTKPGFQNKHCEAPAATQPTPDPDPTTPPPSANPPGPPATTPPVQGQGGPQPPTVSGGNAGGNGGNGGGGGAVAEPAAAVTTETLPFTGIELPQALLATGLLLLLGGAALALGKRRAQQIR